MLFYAFRLRETLEIYEDQNEKEQSQFLKRFPKFIELHHIYSLWKIVAAEYREQFMES